MTDVFRETYTELSDGNKLLIVALKRVAAELNNYLEDGGREMAIARTKLEECVMWAVKDLTKPENNVKQ